MKEFDRVDLGGARTMSEANYVFDRNKGIAARPVIPNRYGEKIKAVYNKVFMRKGEEEL